MSGCCSSDLLTQIKHNCCVYWKTKDQQEVCVTSDLSATAEYTVSECKEPEILSLICNLKSS